MRIKKHSFFFLIFLVFAVAACQDPSEGCLDLEATNFDAAADEDCCCSYPQLVLSYRYFYENDTTPNFQLETNYALENGDSIRFRNFAMYISDVGLVQNGTFIIGEDSLKIYRRSPDLDSSIQVRNINIVRRGSPSSSAGLFPYTGMFEKLRFRFGLDPELNSSPVEDFPRGSVLGIQADSLHTLTPGEGYTFLKLVLYFPVSDIERTFTVKGDLNSFILERDINFTTTRGADRIIVLELNFKDLIAGIDFDVDSDQVISEKLHDNIEAFISVEE